MAKYNKFPYNLARWTRCPGDDFKKKWAQYLLDYEVLYTVWFSLVERPICFIICLFCGHYVIDDHCMKPEHRYCMTCKRLQPYKPITKE
jgi:hypothetical protein